MWVLNQWRINIECNHSVPPRQSSTSVLLVVGSYRLSHPRRIASATDARKYAKKAYIFIVNLNVSYYSAFFLSIVAGTFGLLCCRHHLISFVVIGSVYTIYNVVSVVLGFQQRHLASAHFCSDGEKEKRNIYINMRWHLNWQVHNMNATDFKLNPTMLKGITILTILCCFNRQSWITYLRCRVSLLCPGDKVCANWWQFHWYCNP